MKLFKTNSVLSSHRTYLNLRLITRKILILVLFFSYNKIFSQKHLSKYLINDTIILKHKIKKITKIDYHDTLKTKIQSVEEEYFNEFGQRIKAIEIYNEVRKYTRYYKYKKRKIIEIETIHDFYFINKNHNNDTLITKKIKKYNSKTFQSLSYKKSKLEKYKSKFFYDSFNRIIKKVDTIKCGNRIEEYQYDFLGNKIEIRHFRTYHLNEPKLESLDSFYYDLSGKLIKQKKYSNLYYINNEWVFTNQYFFYYVYDEKYLLISLKIIKLSINSNETYKNEELTTFIYEFH